MSVRGVTGSGKTTFARRLAAAYGVPHIELDALYWRADWQPAPEEEFESAVREAAALESWVIDGNYSRIQELVQHRATMTVWLDYPWWVSFPRLVGRTARRVSSGELHWGHSRERLRSVFSRDSILVWYLRTYARRRREALQMELESTASTVRLSSPTVAETWLQCERAKQGPPAQ